MRQISAFSDESGTVLLGDRDGRYFVVCAVFMARADEEANREKVRQLTRDLKFGKELKSSALRTLRRREELLHRLNELPLNTFFLVVDKDEIDRSSGLVFKPSAFKFLNRRLFDRLFGFFESAFLVADEHGRDKFMAQFQEYLDRELGLSGSQCELFSEQEKTFRFEKSHLEPLIQVADVFAGTLAKCLNGKAALSTIELVRERATGFICFPPQAAPEGLRAKSEVPRHQDTEQDKFVRQYCGQVASDFSVENGEKGELGTACKVLDYLLQERVSGVERFVSTSEIREFLRDTYGVEVSEHQFRNLIGRLRDRGVIVASGANGYKVPTTVDDLESYVALTRNVVLPMIGRLADARTQLMTVSQKRVDILEHDELFRALVERASEPVHPDSLFSAGASPERE